jgi:hypothetical protein
MRIGYTEEREWTTKTKVNKVGKKEFLQHHIKQR